MTTLNVHKYYSFHVTLGSFDRVIIIPATSYGLASKIIRGRYPQGAIISPTVDYVFSGGVS